MISMAVVWACLGGALVAILVLVALRVGQKAEPGSRTEAGPQAPRDPGLDPDDEKVAFSGRRRHPSRRWDTTSGEDDPDNLIDEDDRPAADRPRHSADRWQHD